MWLLWQCGDQQTPYPSKGTTDTKPENPPAGQQHPVQGHTLTSPTYPNHPLKLTKLRYWPWNNFEVRLCEGWAPRESKDFIRWEEGRAHTESLPRPMSEKVMQREERAETLASMHPRSTPDSQQGQPLGNTWQRQQKAGHSCIEDCPPQKRPAHWTELFISSIVWFSNFLKVL